jgi:hypothetical protein
LVREDVATFDNRFEGDNYGQINQAGRDVNVTNVGSLDALLATDALRAELGRLALSPEARRAAEDDLDEVERELRRPEPDRERVAGRLESLTEVLSSAGALAAAGAALLGPIGAIAGFLGPLGKAVLELTRE